MWCHHQNCNVPQKFIGCLPSNLLKCLKLWFILYIEWCLYNILSILKQNNDFLRALPTTIKECRMCSSAIILRLIVGCEMVGLCVHKLGQLISNPYEHWLETVFASSDGRQWLALNNFYVFFVQFAVSECSHFLEWNIVHHSRLPQLFSRYDLSCFKQ